MNIEIRQASEADLELLNRDVKPSFGRTFAQELAEQADGVQSIVIALRDDHCIGWGFIHWPGPRDAENRKRFPDAPELFRLEVEASQRAQGIGTQVIVEMEAMVKACGFSRVSLGVGHENPKAYELYKRLGYADTEITEYYDEYQYPLPDGGVATARDLCRYLVKAL
ncbi:MAG: GNAT family N-acetyltransferase [Pseudomonadales bacterium]